MSHSNSSLQRYKNCPLAYFYQYEVGLVKQEDEKSEHHANFGSAIHEGLKHVYLKDTLSGAIAAFKKLYPIQLDEEDEAKTVETGVQALTGYVKRWSEEDKKWRVLSVEEMQRVHRYLNSKWRLTLFERIKGWFNA